MFPDLTAALHDSIPDGNVLDTEIVVYRDGRLSFDALQHRMISTTEAARLARTEPASLVVFDLILDAGTDLRTLPWNVRRNRLEGLSSPWRPPLQITPYTDDRTTAVEWMTSLAPMGIEGNRRQTPHQLLRQPGRLDQNQIPRNLEGVIGAVIGPLNRPEALIVGTVTGGELHVLGRTTALTPRQSVELGALLQPPTGPHAWPPVMGATHFGGDPVTITHAQPDTIVEVTADPARQAGRRRHPLRYLRIRRD